MEYSVKLILFPRSSRSKYEILAVKKPPPEMDFQGQVTPSPTPGMNLQGQRTDDSPLQIKLKNKQIRT